MSALWCRFWHKSTLIESENVLLPGGVIYTVRVRAECGDCGRPLRMS